MAPLTQCPKRSRLAFSLRVPRTLPSSLESARSTEPQRATIPLCLLHRLLNESPAVNTVAAKIAELEGSRACGNLRSETCCKPCNVGEPDRQGSNFTTCAGPIVNDLLMWLLLQGVAC